MLQYPTSLSCPASVCATVSQELHASRGRIDETPARKLELRASSLSLPFYLLSMNACDKKQI